MEPKFKIGNVLKDNHSGYMFAIEEIIINADSILYIDFVGIEYDEEKLTLVCRAENREDRDD